METASQVLWVHLKEEVDWLISYYECLKLNFQAMVKTVGLLAVLDEPVAVLQTIINQIMTIPVQEEPPAVQALELEEQAEVIIPAKTAVALEGLVVFLVAEMVELETMVQMEVEMMEIHQLALPEVSAVWAVFLGEEMAEMVARLGPTMELELGAQNVKIN